MTSPNIDGSRPVGGSFAAVPDPWQTPPETPPGFAIDGSLSVITGKTIYLGPSATSPDGQTNARTSWSPGGTGIRLRLGVKCHDGIHLDLEEALQLRRVLGEVLLQLHQAGAL